MSLGKLKVNVQNWWVGRREDVGSQIPLPWLALSGHIRVIKLNLGPPRGALL